MAACKDVQIAVSLLHSLFSLHNTLSTITERYLVTSASEFIYSTLPSPWKLEAYKLYNGNVNYFAFSLAV